MCFSSNHHDCDGRSSQLDRSGSTQRGVFRVLNDWHHMTLFRRHLCNDKIPHCRTELEKFPCDGTAIPQSERVAVLSIIRAESQVSTEQKTQKTY